MALGGSYSHDIENFDVVKSFLDLEATVLVRLVKDVCLCYATEDGGC